MCAYNMGIVITSITFLLLWIFTALILLGFIVTFSWFELILMSWTEKTASEEEGSDKSKSEFDVLDWEECFRVEENYG
jgi:hypothetical protein